MLENITTMLDGGGLLFWTWLSSLLLSALSSITMAVLVIARIFSNRREEKHKAQLKKLRLRVMEFMQSGGDLESLQKEFHRENNELLREMALQLLESIKGESRDLLIAMLWGVGVRDDALAQLKKGNIIEKLKAIEVIELFTDEESFAALHHALDDPEPSVKLAAAAALAENDKSLSVSELVEKLDIGNTTRSRMLREIFLKAGRNNLRELLDLLEGVGVEDIAVLTLYAIGRAQDYSVVPAVIKQMRSKSLNVRAEAVRALAAIGHPKAMPAVLDALNDPEWQVRAQAAVCVMRIGFREATGQLVGLLNDGEWWVRFRAAEALAKLGSEGMAALEAASKGSGRSAQIALLVISEKESR